MISAPGLLLVSLLAQAPSPDTSEAPDGALSLTLVGDATGFDGISESDRLNYGRNYWVEPRTRSFARIEKVAGGRRLVHNGEPGPQFKVLANVLFSPDGTRLAYLGRSAAGESLVLDREVQATFTPSSGRLVQVPYRLPVPADRGGAAPASRIQFSPDSRHLAWVQTRPAGEGPGYRIVLDGKPVAEVERIGFLAFTPHDELVWSTCSDRGPGQLVVAGQGGPEFAQVGGLTFAVGGPEFAYYGADASGEPLQYLLDHRVIADLTQPPFAGLRPVGKGVHFSTDLSRFALPLVPAEAAASAAALELFVDGERLDETLRDAPLAFSPTGELFYQRPDGTVVFGGAERGIRGRVLHVTFAPAGSAVLFLSAVDEAVLVVDEEGAVLGPFPAVSRLEFSADGTHRSFVAGPAAGGQQLFVDGELVFSSGGPIAEVRFSTVPDVLTVSADLADAEWEAARERAASLGLRLVRSAPTTRRIEARSRDGLRHASFRLRKGDGAQPDPGASFELYIDREPTGELFDQQPAALAFDEDGVLRFVTRRGTEVLRGEYRP